MKVSVQVKPRSKVEKVEALKDSSLILSFNVPPVEGKANAKTVQMLSKYFAVPKSKIKLIRGYKSKTKVFEIDLT